MTARVSFVALELRQLEATHGIFGNRCQADLPGGAIGVLLAYNTEADAKAAQPDAQIMRVVHTNEETPTPT